VQDNYSFSKTIWKRLVKNKTALVGLVIICLSILVAIFSYIIAPDASVNANMQMVEIQAKKPGYSQQFLKVFDKDKKPDERFSRFFTGSNNNYKLIPIIGYTLNGNTIVIDKYIDEDTSVKQHFNIQAIGNSTLTNFNNLHIVKKTYWLGTDKFGRDILSRLIVGTRVSLGVGLVAVLISLTLGILLGAMAGYFGKRIDAQIMWLINVTWSIPTLLLVFAITLAMGRGFWQVFIAIGLTMWVSVARLVRGQVMQEREREYVQAAKAMGFSHMRIIVKHILPNIVGPILVIASGNFASAIIIEAGLSFLGVGVQPPQPSWGLMIKENYNFIITHNPMLALIPGFAIMLLVLAFNLLGNGLRDAIDVKN
jgi:ABC-type dipeptide/oligopeptide/nickel transport system permease subunit